MTVQFDVDAVVQRIGGRRAGVICTPAGYIPPLGTLGDLLAGRADVRGMLALEHGLRGELQDGVHFDAYTDAQTGIPVFSYYGGSHTFPQDFFAELDVIVFHAQDVSHRAYTYKQTLADTLVAAAAAGVEVIVADRPTPLGHFGSQGPLHTQYFPEPLPVLQVYTLGELARWLRGVRGLDVSLEVVPPQGWRRSRGWDETGLPWIPPSPNLPSLHSAYAYTCLGILQHSSFSEGRGTCKPFEYVGAPGVDGAALAKRLNALELPGVLFREVFFIPAFNKFKGEVCGGIHLMFTNVRRFEPLRTMWLVLQELLRAEPERFRITAGFGRWLDGSEWTGERLAETPAEDFLAEGTRQSDRFDRSIEPYRLYED